MKKILIIILASIGFLFGASLVCYSLGFVGFSNAWIPLVIGSSIFVLSVILLIIFSGKDNKFVVSCTLFFINIISIGFLIKSWHMFRGYNLELYVLSLVSLACVAYLLVFYFISYIPFFSKHYKGFIITYLLLSVIVYIVLIMVTRTNYLSTFGYYLIFEIGFLFVLGFNTKDIKELIKAISLSAYTIIAVAMVLFLDDGIFKDIFLSNSNFIASRAQDSLKFHQE